MKKTFTRYLLMCVVWFGVASCQEEEISTPPKPSLQADKTSAEVGEDVTFTINEVNADAVSLLPYGLPGGDAGVLLTFTDGVATVVFKYERPGTFQAIAVANNHTDGGDDVRNVQSDPVTITITSSASEISDFKFITIKETDTEFQVIDVSTETKIDQDARTIHVTVPFGTDLTNLVAAFTASAYATVSVGGVEQTTEETANNFWSPVVYTVKADDGTTTEYTVTVTETPAETLTTIKSITPVAASKSIEDRAFGVAIDNTNHTIVVYDTLGTGSEQFDSVSVGYQLDGEFAMLKYGDAAMDQDKVLDLTSSREFTVVAQDKSSQTYTVYATDAPKLTLSFPDLNPDPAAATKPADFTLNIPVLTGTDVTAIKTNATTMAPANATVDSITANGDPFTNGDAVDYSEPVEFKLTVTDNDLGVTYVVTYTVTVTVTP